MPCYQCSSGKILHVILYPNAFLNKISIKDKIQDRNVPLISKVISHIAISLCGFIHGSCSKVSIADLLVDWIDTIEK